MTTKCHRKLKVLSAIKKNSNFLHSLFSSTHTLAVILSSESINSETAAQDPVVENVLPSPDLSSSPPSSSSESDNVVSDKPSDTPTNNERTNFNKQEEIVVISQSDSGAGSGSAKSEHEIKPDQIVSNSEAEAVSQRQPQTTETNDNVDKIPEQKVTTQKSSVDNV